MFRIASPAVRSATGRWKRSVRSDCSDNCSYVLIRFVKSCKNAVWFYSYGFSRFRYGNCSISLPPFFVFLFFISMYRSICSSPGKKRASPNGGALQGLFCYVRICCQLRSLACRGFTPLLAIACRFHEHVLAMTIIFFVAVDPTKGIQILVTSL